MRLCMRGGEREGRELGQGSPDRQQAKPSHAQGDTIVLACEGLMPYWCWLL